MWEYFYPTITGWIEDMRDKWIAAKNDSYFSFSFLNFHPDTLPKKGAFWMYFYYTLKAEQNSSFGGNVEFRVHILEHSKTQFQRNSVFIYPFQSSEPVKIWFLCDRIERIERQDDQVLTLGDFKHAKGKELGSTIRNSIAPVIPICPKIIEGLDKTWTF